MGAKSGSKGTDTSSTPWSAKDTQQTSSSAQQEAQAKTEAAFERDIKGLTENYTKDLSARDLERLRVKYNLTSSQARDVGVAGSKIESTLSAPQRFQARVQEALKGGLTAREVESIGQEFNLTQQEKGDLARYGYESEKQALAPFKENVFERVQGIEQTFAYPVGRTEGFMSTEKGITQPSEVKKY